MKRTFLCVFLSLAVMGMLVSVSHAQQKPTTYNWRLQATHITGDPPFQWMFPRLVQKLDELSNGRIKLTCFPGGALVPVPETLNMLGKGVYEMASSVGAYWQGLIPAAGLEFGFPGSWHSTPEQMVLFHDKGMTDILRQAYAEHGVRYLSVYHIEPFCIESTVKVKNLNDLRKLKVRSIGVPTLLLNKLGVKTATIAWAELYMAMKLRTVDACTVGLYYWYQGKIPEIAKYVLWPPLYDPSSGNILMNLKTWTELPPDIKQIVNYAVDDAVWYMYRMLQEQFDFMYDKLKKEYGVEFITLPPEDQAEIKKAARELWPELAAKDKYSAQIMKIIEDYSRFKGHTK